jgi:hypothetical protein
MHSRVPNYLHHLQEHGLEVGDIAFGINARYGSKGGLNEIKQIHQLTININR